MPPPTPISPPKKPAAKPITISPKTVVKSISQKVFILKTKDKIK
jgi:hypothetical protein